MATRKETAHRKLSLVEELRRDYRSGRLVPGEMLPPVRLLATRFGISRRIVNDEVQKLAEEGWLHSVPRVGIFVRKPESTGFRLMDHAVVVISSLTREGNANTKGSLDGITEGVIREIHRQGLHSVLMHPDRLCGEMVDRVAKEQPYGAIVPEMGDPRRYGEILRQAGVRVVMYGDDAGIHGFDRVKSDQERGAYELTRWLIGQGRTRIRQVWVGDSKRYWCRERMAGYRRGMTEAGLKPLPAANSCSAGHASKVHAERVVSWAAALKPCIVPGAGNSQPDDALLGPSDGEVADLFAACRALGRDPERDLLICGYDNYWRDLDYMGFAMERPAATVDKNNESLGGAMVQLLMERAEPPGAEGGRSVNGRAGVNCRVIQPRLVVPGLEAPAVFP